MGKCGELCVKIYDYGGCRPCDFPKSEGIVTNHLRIWGLTTTWSYETCFVRAEIDLDAILALIPGTPGPAGPVGPIGPVGDVGIAGLVGPQGNQGSVGNNGPQGPAGAIGNIGAVGPVGIIGPSGIAGIDNLIVGPIGPVGLVGLPGFAGAIGVTGPIGASGVVGNIGPIGSPGANGNQGPAGLIGPVGPQGLIGNQGAIGPQGPAGPQGIIGNIGPIGSSGPVGNVGPIGLQGIIGNQGPVGISGPNGNVGPIGSSGPVGNAGPIGPQGPNGNNVSSPATPTLLGGIFANGADTANGSAVGYQVGIAGVNNAVFGIHGLFSNVTGAQNSALGIDALPGASNFNRNVTIRGLRPTFSIIGFPSGFEDNVVLAGMDLTAGNNNGARNCAMGKQSLDSNSITMVENVAVGNYSSKTNSFGSNSYSYNTTLGIGAHAGIFEGESNCSVGTSSGQLLSVANPTSTHNCFLGASAGTHNNTLANSVNLNVCVGAASGDDVGDNSVTLGPQTDSNSLLINPANAVGIGHNIRVRNNNITCAGNSQIHNDVSGNITVIGSRSSYGGNNIIGGVILGYNNGVPLQDGNQSIIGMNILHTSPLATSNVFSFGFGVVGESPVKSNQIYFHSTLTSLKMPSLYQDNAGGGMAQLLMDGIGEVYKQASKKSLKDSITPLTQLEGYQSVLNLLPRAYMVADQQAFGFVAEEVEEAGFGSLCTYDHEGKLSGVNYPMINVYLVQELIALKTKIEILESL